MINNHINFFDEKRCEANPKAVQILPLLKENKLRPSEPVIQELVRIIGNFLVTLNERNNIEVIVWKP